MGISNHQERLKLKKNTLSEAFQRPSNRNLTVVNNLGDILRLKELKKSVTKTRDQKTAIRRLSTSALRVSNNSDSKSLASFDHSDIIPPWLSSREDFQQNCIKLQQNNTKDLLKIAQIPSSVRTNEESEALYLWIRQSDFFKTLPQSIVRELCNNLSAKHYFAYQMVIQQGDTADCLYIVYKGRVSIYCNNEIKARVEPGGYFGEMALDKNTVRAADVVTDVDTVLFILKDSDYKRIVFSVKNLEKSLNTKLLINIPLFTEMSYTKMQSLLNSCVLSVFSPGDTIFTINSSSSSFYILQQGLVELQIFINIEKVNKWPIGTKTWNVLKVNQKYAVKYKECKDGEYFGEFEILKGCERQTRAVVVETAKCLVVNSQDLKDHYWIKDTQKLARIQEEYERGIEEAEKAFKKKLIRKSESEELLKGVIKENSKRGRKLKDVLTARKMEEDKVLKKQLIENSKKEKIKGIGSLGIENPVFRSFGVDYNKRSDREKKLVAVVRKVTKSVRLD